MNNKLIMTFLVITVTLDASGFGIIAPVLPSLIEEVSQKGISDAARIGGYMTFAFGIVQFVFGPVIGNLSDAYGRRPVLLVSLFGMSISYAILALAPSVAWLITARIFGGLTSATRATANAVITDVSTGSQKARNFGLLGAAFGLGFIIGPAIGGALSVFGTRAPFWGAAVIALCNFAFGYFVFKETHAKEERRPFDLHRANPLASFAKIGKSRAAILFSGVFFCYGFSATVYPSIWSFFTQARFAFEPWMIAVTLVAFGIATALSQAILVRPAIGKLGARKVVTICFGAQAVIYLGIAFSYSPWLLVFFLALGGLFSVVGPALQDLVTRLVQKSEQGELQGILASIQSLASLVGTIVMTQGFAHFSDDVGVKFDGAPFIFSMIAIVIALWLFQRAINKDEIKSLLDASSDQSKYKPQTQS